MIKRQKHVLDDLDLESYDEETGLHEWAFLQHENMEKKHKNVMVTRNIRSLCKQDSIHVEIQKDNLTENLFYFQEFGYLNDFLRNTEESENLQLDYENSDRQTRSTIYGIWNSIMEKLFGTFKYESLTKIFILFMISVFTLFYHMIF